MCLPAVLPSSGQGSRGTSPSADRRPSGHPGYRRRKEEAPGVRGHRIPTGNHSRAERISLPRPYEQARMVFGCSNSHIKHTLRGKNASGHTHLCNFPAIPAPLPPNDRSMGKREGQNWSSSLFNLASSAPGEKIHGPTQVLLPGAWGGEL